MNALTSGALANRLWVMSDVIVVCLAVLGLNHGSAALARWQFPASSLTTTTATPAPPSPLPGLRSIAALLGGWCLLSAMLTAGLALRGPIRSPIPTASPEAVDLARRNTLQRTGLDAQILPDSPLIWAKPVRFGSARALLPDRLATGHWSRAFIPRNHTRTVITSTTADGNSTTLQIPGDARHLPEGPFLAVGVLNHDPHAFFGAEIDMIEVLALWPLDNLESPAATPIIFPVRSTVRSLVPKAPKSASGKSREARSETPEK